MSVGACGGDDGDVDFEGWEFDGGWGAVGCWHDWYGGDFDGDLLGEGREMDVIL